MSYTIVFSGSLMNGLNKDLIAWSGLRALTDEEHDMLWGQINEHDLLEQCDAAEICFLREEDEALSYSDNYYEVHCEDEQRLKIQLKEALTDFLDSSSAT